MDQPPADLASSRPNLAESSKPIDWPWLYIRFIIWVLLTLALPPLLLLVSAVVTTFYGRVVNVPRLLGSGDLLLAVVLVLAQMVCASTVTLFTSAQPRNVRPHLTAFSLWVIVLVCFFIYSILYGALVVARLDGIPVVLNTPLIATFSMRSFIGVAVFCSIYYGLLLKAGCDV
jgi:hypothetical protein